MNRTNLSNLITTLYNPDDRDRAMKRLVLRCLINSLTSASCNALMSHFYESANPDRVATLDARNREDAEIRGRQLADEHREEVGHVVPMPSYTIAQITNALRYRLYAECLTLPNEHGKMDFLTPRGHLDPLIDDLPPVMPQRGDFTNYDQPMSAEWLLKFRVRKAVEPDEDAVHRFAMLQQAFLVAPLDVDAAAAQLVELKAGAYTLELENGRKDQAKLRAYMPQVLDELRGMWGAKEVGEDSVAEDGELTPADSSSFGIFASLPLTTQQKIGKGVVQKLTNAYATTYKRTRTKPELLGECMLIMGLQRKAKLWLDDIDHLIAQTEAHEALGEDAVNGVADLTAEVEALVNTLEVAVPKRKTKSKVASTV